MDYNKPMVTIELEEYEELKKRAKQNNIFKYFHIAQKVMFGKEGEKKEYFMVKTISQDSTETCYLFYGHNYNFELTAINAPIIPQP